MITIAPEEVEPIIKEKGKVQIIDIRPYSHYKKSHIPGAISIPRDRFAEFQHHIQTGVPIFIYCQYGMKSDEIALYMEKKFKTNVYVLEGGYEAYEEAF
ncbi:MAG: rhodanese-like domain-containing protein [Bacteroidales bacterium]|nr:rhodanese-like domain-containing protein [Bacteroidales bacterium]MCF8334026.1 rhodanese-like domain-containing protein [Bacteroidales bacterium]